MVFKDICRGAEGHVPVKRRVASPSSQLLLKSRASVAWGNLTKPAVVRSSEVGRSAAQTLAAFLSAQTGREGVRVGFRIIGLVLWKPFHFSPKSD